MAVGTVYSANATQFRASPHALFTNARSKIMIDTIEVATTSMDDVGDIIMFGPIHSNARIIRLGVMNDALAASGLAYNIGGYYTGVGGEQLKNGKTEGTVVDADNIGTAVAFSTARVVLQDVRFEAADIANIGDELWKVLGLTEDPGGLFYLALTCSTVATTPAAGTISLVVEWL